MPAFQFAARIKLLVAEPEQNAAKSSQRRTHIGLLCG
jgi:hypothetical protein